MEGWDFYTINFKTLCIRWGFLKRSVARCGASVTYSCESVSLTVWSEGRRHTGHWRDEKFHLLSHGHSGVIMSEEGKRGRARQRQKRDGEREIEKEECPPPVSHRLFPVSRWLKLLFSRVHLCHAPPRSLLKVFSFRGIRTDLKSPDLEGHTHLPQSANIHRNEILISQKVCIHEEAGF